VFNNWRQFIRMVPVLPRDELDMDDVDTAAEDHVGAGDERRRRGGGWGIRTTETVAARDDGIAAGGFAELTVAGRGRGQRIRTTDGGRPA